MFGQLSQMSLEAIIDAVERRERTLTIYDAIDPSAVEAVKRHFAVQNVRIEESNVEDGPANFAVLHDDGEFLAGSDLEDLRSAVEFDGRQLDVTSFAETQPPEILRHVDDTTFTAYGKRRMILASREIEEWAWRAGGGELHAGFQDLSLLREQWDNYSRLADCGVDVHVYGVPDWEPPETERVTVHAEDDQEIRGSWFVSYEAEDHGDRTLLAVEREPNVFAGFWSYDEDVTADVLDHLRENYSVEENVEASEH